MNDAELPPTRPVESYPYATHLDIMFAPLRTIDVDAVVRSVRDEWYNQTRNPDDGDGEHRADGGLSA